MRECEYCGKLFSEKNGHEIFCSEECRHKQKLIKRRIKLKEKIEARDFKPRRSHLEWTDDDVQNRINTKSDKMVYIGGYVDSESYMYLYCSDCGQAFRWSAKGLRRQRQIRCLCCEHILADAKDKEKRKTSLEQKRIKHEELIQKRMEAKKRICKNCGDEFISSRTGNTYCSADCRRKYENRIHAFRKRVKRNTVIKDKGITIERIMKRDGCNCWLCNKAVDMNDFIIRPNGSFVAGGSYPSIDHVQALANGGQHTWSNVRLAHVRCNRKKSDNEFMETEEGQIKLFC